MANHSVTRLQKNQLMELIQASGLEQADFRWSEDQTEVNRMGLGQDRYTVEVLTHTPTGYYFKFDVLIGRASPWAIYLPGPDGPRKRDHAGSWDLVAGYFERWVARVAQEHRAPDLWSALQEQRELMAGDVVENTPFTPEEQQAIAASLGEAKEYARANLELEAEQLDRIEAQLDYLVEASARSRRVDWRNLLVGSLLSQVMQSLLPLGAVQQVLFIVLHGLAAVFGGGGTPELPGGQPPEAV